MISLLDLCFYRATGMLHEMGGEKCLAFVFLWMTTQNLMTGALQVHLEPTSVLKHVNEHLELVCTALDCPGEAQFMWRGLLDTTIGGKMEWNQTTSRRVYSQLTVADEKTVICKVKCGVHKEARTKIQVYSFPSDPVISRWKASSLLCTVHSVYPFNWFTFNWLRGETRLTGREVSDVYKEGIQDIYSEYTPSEEDLGKNITCRVTLALAGVPKGHQVRSVTVQYGPASINISRNTTVKIGERLELKCDAEGQFNITWKKLEKNEATPLTTDKVIMIEKATLSHAGEYECEASNELASRRSTVGVIVKGPPNVPNIRLSQVGNPRAGDNVTIICDSDSVLPVLTISGASLNQVEKESSSVSVNLPSIQLRDSGIYHCEAKNELGSTRSSVTVTVHAPPMNSTVVVHPSAPVMEAQNVTIHCSTVSFPPASFTLKREDDGLEFASTNGIFHLFNLRSEDKGIYLVNFTNELGYETQTIHLVVIGPPNVPNIRLSQVGNPRAGDNVTIICDSDSVLPVLTISGASLNQVEKESSSVSVNLPSIQLRDSGIYHCEAKNELGSTRSSVTVTVHAPPMNSTVVVHPSAPVMEAQNVTIHCSTVSFPPASFTLKREDDGLEFASTNGIFHLFNLRSEDKGIYLVNFTNELGYETQTIHLVVIEGEASTLILTKAIVPSVSSISLLTAAALLIRHLRRAKKDSFGPSLGDALDL
ncbi:vascular cell adhesion protein 1 [Salminus brasiliensis]|uniref:vascular cell adhesion protein 1 n=1 Tax=Salminus brasiliensis TaxID=930266 RepID=UPI003B83595F